MKTKLQTVLDRVVAHLSLSPEIANKLVRFIDLQKVKGLTSPYASSKFGDYLGFLQIPDTEAMQQFFVERWADHVVWSEVPKEYMKFLSAEMPMFTPSRLEPRYQETRFYDAGLVKVPAGENSNPENGGSVRTVPREEDSYGNFIIFQFLPEYFYMEVPNGWVATLLHQGLPEASDENPYSLSMSIDEARSELQKKLYNETHTVATKVKLLNYTLIAIDPTELKLDNDVFYPNNSLYRHSARSFGHYYTGEIPAKAISIAHENIT